MRRHRGADARVSADVSRRARPCLPSSGSGSRVAVMILLWRARLALAVFVVALLAVAQVQRPHASANIVWRFLVVSLDRRSTQALDALATAPARDGGAVAGV